MVCKPVVVITGASKGIGRNIALFFAEKGYTVVATDKELAGLEETGTKLKNYAGNHTIMAIDVRKADEVANAIDQIINTYKRIDVWINNAGVFNAIGPTWEVKKEDFLDDLQTNLFGSFHCTQAVVRIMLKQNFGRIINMVGGGTAFTFKNGNGYSTSKTAVARFTENLAAELEATPIKVFAFDPGLNETDLTRFQRESEVEQSFLPHVKEGIEKNKDVLLDAVPDWAYHIASGELDAYTGRVVSVQEQFAKLRRKAKEKLDSDGYKLRLFH